MVSCSEGKTSLQNAALVVFFSVKFVFTSL